MTDYDGLWPACPTLINGDETIDDRATRALARRLKSAGASGLWLFGSGGEGTALSDETRRRFVAEILDETGDDFRLLVGISAESLTRVEARWRPLSDLPVAGVFATPPIYYTYQQQELIRFFDAIPRLTGKPTFIYHNPFFAHTSLETDSLVELSYSDGIVGAKDSTTSMIATQRIIAKAKPGFAVLQGEERLAGLSLLAGAVGIVSVVSAANPDPFVRIIAAARSLDLAAVREEQAAIDAFVEELGLIGRSTNGQFIGAVKRALAEQGFGSGAMSAPFDAPGHGPIAPDHAEQHAALSR